MGHPANKSFLRLLGLTDKTLDRIGVPAKSVGRLLHDDDWSIVVKSVALIEAALNETLTAVISPIEASRFVVRQNLERKIELAKEIGVLSTEHATAIKILAEIRNKTVHDPRQMFKFSLDDYLAGAPLTAEKFKASFIARAVKADGLRPIANVWFATILILAALVKRTDALGTIQRLPPEPN